MFAAAATVIRLALFQALAQDTSTNSYVQYSPAFAGTNEPPPPPPAVETTPAPRLTGTSQLGPRSPVPLPTVPPLLYWGPVSLQSHAFYSLSYGNGLQASPGQKADTLVNQVEPGMLLQFGSHWTLDYTPLLTFYSSRDLRDTFDNSVTLAGASSYKNWSFAFSQNYVSSSDPIIETASQLDQDTYSTGLNANWQIGTQTSIELGANQNFRFLANTIPGEELADVRSWATMNWLNYQFWSRLGAAVGAGFGYDDLSVGSDMTSEQLQGRVTWVVVRKLSFVLSGGAEDRQFLSSGVPALISPVFSFSAQYSPFDVTTLSLSAARSVSPSYFEDQVSESTSISAGLHQRLLSKLFLDLSAGYANSTYHSSAVNPANANLSSYDTTSFSARLTAPFLKRGSASVFYAITYNSSGAAIYDYTTTQVGLQLTYRY